jgi:hypothetical protein
VIISRTPGMMTARHSRPQPAFGATRASLSYCAFWDAVSVPASSMQIAEDVRGARVRTSGRSASRLVPGGRADTANLIQRIAAS